MSICMYVIWWFRLGAMSNINPLWTHIFLYLIRQVLALLLTAVLFNMGIMESPFHSAFIEISLGWAILLSPFFWLLWSLWKDRKPAFRFAVNRWFIYQVVVSLFAWLLWVHPHDFGLSRSDGEFVSMCLHFLPPLWVWRKPILKRIRKLISSLNNAAEEDWDSLSCRPCVWEWLACGVTLDP